MRRLIYKLGIRIWNRDIFDKYDHLMESQYWDIDKLLSWQLEKLKNLINVAYNGSTYYREIFDSKSFRPEDINTLEDIKKIPVIVKDDLLKNRDRIQIKVAGKPYPAETSGSTGEPLVFNRDREWDAWMRASLFRGFESLGQERFFVGIQFFFLETIQGEIAGRTSKQVQAVFLQKRRD